jgi:hypothetical protein
MWIPNISTCFVTACVFFTMQSLADIAREEAERRQLLEQQGIEGRIIERRDAGSAPKENQAKALRPSDGQKKASTENAFPKSQASVRRYRAALQKLDRRIRQEEERLVLKRVRLEENRWALPKTGRLSTRSQAADTQERLQKEIDELQIKLKGLRLEREETYEEGRKAGFLPGELEGKN